MSRSTSSPAAYARVLFALCLFAPLRAHAQGNNTQSASPKVWRFSVTPYAWLTDLQGRVGIGPLATDVDLGVGDILKALNFAAMGYADARRGPLVLAIDAMYAALGSGKVVAFRGDTGRFDLDQHETILQPQVGYTIGTPTWNIDFLAGTRIWILHTDLDVDTSRRPSNERSDTQSWADITGGIRANALAMGRIRLVAAADGGAGGSQSTWQTYGTVGYDFASRWTVGLTYRSLWVDYDHDRFLFDVNQKGFLLAATYRF